MRAAKVVLAAALVCLVVIGCGRKGGDGAKPAVKLWHIQVSGPTKDAVEAAVARVQARHPEVDIQAVGFKNDSYKTKLRLAMEGAPPDVFHTWGGGGLAEYVDRGKVLDLSGDLDGDELRGYNPRALSFCRLPLDGSDEKPLGLYALPADITAVVVWYNREIFELQELAVPKTWADFEKACARLKAVKITPVSLGNSQKWPGCFYYMYFATRLGGMEPFASERYGDASFVAAGDRIRSMVSDGHFNRGLNGIGYDISRREFFTGKAAMTLMGSWILSHARSEAPEFLPKMGCFAFPAIAGGQGKPRTVIGGMNAGYAVSSSTASRAVAVELARELTGLQAAKEWAAAGRIPGRVDVALGEVDAPTASLMKVLGSADAIQLYYDQALPPGLASVHKDTVQGLFAETMTGAEVAAKMTKEARRVSGTEGAK